MENALVSIIVPVYNVSCYLRRCLDSILDQVYKNLEIILIDDGSSDGSGVICDEYQKKDSRIKVIHQKNGGLSYARNMGMNMAMGKYIAFVDSDDFVHEEYVSMMYKIAVESSAQMVICNYEKGKKSYFSGNGKENTYNLYTSTQMLKNWHSTYSTLETPAWNKLIARDVVKETNFQYPEGVFHEDVAATHWLLCGADKVAITERKLYYYFQRKSSITKRLGDTKNINDNLTAQDSRIIFFKKAGYEEAVHRLMIGRQKHYMLMFCVTKSRETKRKLKLLFGDSYKLIISFKETTWIEKCMFYIFNCITYRLGS